MRFQLPLVYVDAVARAGSIRKAADSLVISSTALNRRIIGIEEDVGAPLFERLPGGVRLSAAGEVFLHFARREIAEAERVKERVAELSGERRGHIAFACGQAPMQSRLPTIIADYRRDFSRVTLDVRIVGRSDIAALLEGFDIDLALILEPESVSTIDVIASAEQPVQLLCRKDHPLIDSDGPVRLHDCLDYPMALPSRRHGIRHLLDDWAARNGRRLPVVVDSDSSLLLTRLLHRDWAISFCIPANTSMDTAIGDALVLREIDKRDLGPAQLSLLQLRGRTLPVAAARFAQRLVDEISADNGLR